MNVDSPDIMSASSDAPIEAVDTLETVEAENIDQVEPEEQETAEGIEDSSTSNNDGVDSPAEPKRKNRTQERIDELTAKRREAEREAEYWKNKVQTPQVDDYSTAPVKPTLESLDFDSDRYESAMEDYAAKKAKHEIYQSQQQQAQQQAQLEQQRQEWAWQAKAGEFAKLNPDFHQVVSNPELRITSDMATAIKASEKGPEISYHLAKNPQLAAEIASLPQHQQYMQLGRIEAELSVHVKTVTPTKAPPPVRPIGSQAAVEKSPEKMSYDEYKAWRMKKQN